MSYLCYPSSINLITHYIYRNGTLYSKSSNKGLTLSLVFSIFLLLAFSSFVGPLCNYYHIVLAFKPSLSTATSQSSMPIPTALITNIAVDNGPNHFLTYENSTYGIKMQYPSNWYKHLGGYIHELANGTKYDLVSFSPLAANQTAAINSLRLHFRVSESLLKKTYPAGIPDFNASLRVSIYYPYEKGKTLSQYASDEYGFGKLLTLTTNNTLGGLPAYKSTYSSTALFAIPERGMHIGAIKGNKVYILSYEASPNEYDKYMSIVQQMINTFQITSSQRTNATPPS